MVAITTEDILKAIRGLASMGQLEPHLFAEEGGYAHVLAREFGKRLNSTQLRKVFGTLKQVDIRMKGEPKEKQLDRSELDRLIPELAYARGRGVVPEEFYDLLKMCLSRTKTQTVGDFRRLIEFLTALLAYHKLWDRRAS